MPSPTTEAQRERPVPFPRHLGRGMRPGLVSHSPLPGTAPLEGTAKPQAIGKLLHGQQSVTPLPTAPSSFLWSSVLQPSC